MGRKLSMGFNREQFEKDIIAEVLKMKDRLEKKYEIKCELDVTWSVPKEGFGKKKIAG